MTQHEPRIDPVDDPDNAWQSYPGDENPRVRLAYDRQLIAQGWEVH